MKLSLLKCQSANRPTAIVTGLLVPVQLYLQNLPLLYQHSYHQVNAVVSQHFQLWQHEEDSLCPKMRASSNYKESHPPIYITTIK